MLPWTATAATEGLDTPVIASVVYTYFAPDFSPPALRLGDECFIPASQAKRIGWKADVGKGTAMVTAGAATVETFSRELKGEHHIPLRTVLSALGGLSEWNPESNLRVFSRIRRIAVEQNRIVVDATLAVSRSVMVLQDPPRIVVDLDGARLLDTSPPAVNGPVRYSQFDADTVRVVAQLKGEAKLASLGSAASSTVSVSWTGATSTVPTPYVAPKPGGTIKALRLEKDALDDTVLRVDGVGMAAGKLAATKSPSGEFMVALQPAAPTDTLARITGQALEYAEIVEAEVTGWTLRFKPKGRMAVRVSSDSGGLIVRLVALKNAGGLLADKTIVIDAGHGGSDSGATFTDGNTTFYEKNFTLDISKRLAAGLAETGATVVMPREDDSTVYIYDRPELANRSGAHFFISVHINSNKVKGSSTGTFTYYHGEDVHSRELAEAIQAEIVKATGLKNNGVRSDLTLYKQGLAVLRKAGMPAVLIEVAYLNNDLDRAMLQLEDFRESVAAAILKGIKAYIGEN